MSVLELPVAHVADTHIDAEMFPQAVSPRGGNQRGEDMARAFANVATHIRDHDDLPLVLHAGDVADTPHPPISYLISMQKILSAMAQPDKSSGYQRQVVVISGNHDMPRNPTEPCFLALYNDIPGVHIVTAGYRVVTFEKEVAAGIADPRLEKVAVHCLPHDDLQSADWDEMEPIEGYLNIFMSHGVAEGSALFVRSKGREYHIPNDVLSKDWDYVALGHYHKQGPVFLSTKIKDSNSRIWYSGSTERCGFSDLTDESDNKGYLISKIVKGKLPIVNKVNLPIRPMFYLPAIDADGKTADEISALLVRNVEDCVASGKLSGSIVRQKIFNVDRSSYGLVNVTKARNLASTALDYSVKPDFKVFIVDDSIETQTDGEPIESSRELNYKATLSDLASSLVDNEELRVPTVERALGFLNVDPQTLGEND